MKTKFEDTGYGKMYLWVTKAKLTMGVFYAAFTMVYLLLGLTTKDPAITLGFWTAFEMMMVSFVIGIIQQIILPTEKYSTSRGAVWVVLGLIITLAASLLFGWFNQFPGWCLPVFLLVFAIGMVAMLVSCYLELQRETKLLNQGLSAFQNRKQVNG